MATYTVVAVLRTPQSAAGPFLTELGPLPSSIVWKDILNEASEATFVMDVHGLQEDIKASLRDLTVAPLEVWVYRDSEVVFAGPVVGGQITDGALTLTCRGLEFYMEYMLVDENWTWTATEQNEIVTDLIDFWQGYVYGDYGINTVTVGASGTVRDFFVPAALEPRTIYETMKELAAVDNGPEFHVDPDTRELVLGTRGNDLSTSIFLERGVKSGDIGFAIAPGIIASEVYATGTNSGLDDPLSTIISNIPLRSSFGRCGFSITADGADTAALLTDAAQAASDDRDGGLFVPGPGLIPVAGAGVEDFGVGDIITYTFDAGLGQQTGGYRIAAKSVEVGPEGQETITVDFV